MIFQRFIKDPFFRHSALFFCASILVAFLNYLFHPVLARLLSLEEFGDVQALLALFGMLSTIMSGFAIASVHASVNISDPDECSSVIASLRKTALMVIGTIVVILLVGSQFFSTELHFSSAWLFVLLGASLLVHALQTFRIGYLQGQKNFVAVSIASIIVSGGRVLIAATFVWMGWRAFGAVFGFLTAQLIAFSFVFWKTRQALTSHKSLIQPTRLKEELAYVAFFAISTIFVTLLYNTDILIVKRFFDPELAGGYSGISTMANIVFFATSSFATVLLSTVKRSHTPLERKKLFFKSLSLVSVIGGSFVLLCVFYSNGLTQLLMGERYLSYAHLLPWLVLAFFCASISNICVYFSLALREKRLLYLILCVSFLLVLLTVFRHNSLIQIAQNYLAVNIVALVGLVPFIGRQLYATSYDRYTHP